MGVLEIVHTIGLSLLPAVYFIVLKRSSILFDVVLGNVVHGETHLYTRLLGAVMMLAAIALIIFG